MSTIDRGEGRPVVVIGAGGHAKVVIDCLRASGWKVIGCTDRGEVGSLCNGAPVLGDDSILERLRAEGVGHGFCALGSNRLRQKLGRGLCDLGFAQPVAMGPNVFLSGSVTVGEGTVLMPGATVNADSRIGRFAIINSNASVDHDNVIGEAAHIAPGSALAGCITVGERSFVATGSAVIPGITIGADVVVGAGSVVIRDLPDAVTAYGNPARVRSGAAG